MFKLITSWDDGDVLDLKLAKLLAQYGFKGTFYLTRDYKGNRLTDKEIRSLAEQHEVGAHTLTHRDLRPLSLVEKKQEILGSKEWLEGIVGKTISTFCYPYGFYDEETVRVVRESGFSQARTTSVGKGGDVLEMAVSLQVYPFPFRKKDAKTYNWQDIFKPFLERAHDLHRLGVPYSAMTSWGKMARAGLISAMKEDREFHLWGHSWEIERYGMWGELEDFLKYASTIKR